jgi:hypothetical protein
MGEGKVQVFPMIKSITLREGFALPAEICESAWCVGNVILMVYRFNLIATHLDISSGDINSPGLALSIPSTCQPYRTIPVRSSAGASQTATQDLDIRLTPRHDDKRGLKATTQNPCCPTT